MDQFKIDKTNDTLSILTSGVSGGKWFLIVKESKLKLIKSLNSKEIDSTVYHYEKRKFLNNLKTKDRNYSVLGNDVTKYFNDKLFKGLYINKETENKVVFGENGRLIEINDFDSYEVRNYFGTMHLHKNLDVITFINKKSRNFKQYNWVFKGNELLLTEFVFEKVVRNGKLYEEEYMVLGKEKIKLRKDI